MSIAAFSSKWSSPSVRTCLALLVIACILPVAAVVTSLIVNFYGKEREQLTNNSVTRAHNLSAVDRELDSTQLALQVLATSRMLGAPDLAGFHARALEVVGRLHADSIVALAPDGQLLLTTGRPFGTPLPKLASAPLLTRILATGEPGVSDLFKGPIGDKLIYTVGVPVWRDGAIVMTLNATATPFHLVRLIDEQKLPANWRASVIDSSGQVVTRSHDLARFAGRMLNPELRSHLAARDQAGFVTQTLDGIDVFVVFSRSARTGWISLIGIPLAELTAGLQTTLAWLVSATLGALGAGLALAWLIGGRIARSVQALVAPALAVGSGLSVPLPPLHFKEAKELGQALHDAAASVLHARADTLESQQRLVLAADAAHLGIWIRDLPRQAIWISDQWRALFGFTAEQQVGLDHLLARVHPDDRPAVRRTLDSAMQGVPRYEMEYQIVLPDGELRWIGSHGSVETDAGGRPALVRGVSLDITQRKQAELEVQQKQKEVTHLSRVAVLGELSGALAHELNQPLTAILSNAQAGQRFLERQPPDTGEVAEILHDIIAEDRRAGEIIQRLRRLFDKNETPRQLIDASLLVDEMLQLLRNDLINHGVTGINEPSPQALPVSADTVQLQQVLINLLINACDATAAKLHGDKDGVITVRVALATPSAVQISIVDSGTGIAEAALARIFEPFFSTKERGMGLGLSICRNIIAAHQGELWAHNNAGDGASCHLRLPLAAGVPP